MKYLYPPFYYHSKLPVYFSNKRWLLIFVSLDFFLMLLHSLSSLGILPDHYYSYISNNFGYGEIYQYIKCIFLSAILIKLFVRLSQPILLLWATIFFYILLDDSLEIHELLGGKLASVSFIGNKTLGEFLVFAGIGTLLLSPVIIMHFRLSERYMKIFDQDMAILFAVLVTAGAGIDIIHDFPKPGTLLKGILTLMEDGGEMIALSIIAWYVLNFYQERQALHRHYNTAL